MSLKEIKELTENMPDLSSISMGHFSNHAEYMTNNGTCIGFPLYKDKDVGVIRTFMPGGSEIAEHVHKDSTEIGVAYQGELILTINGSQHTYRTHEVMTIPKGTPHTVKAVIDSWMIFLT